MDLFDEDGGEGELVVYGVSICKILENGCFVEVEFLFVDKIVGSFGLG